MSFHYSFSLALRWGLPLSAGICLRSIGALLIFLVFYFFLMQWALQGSFFMPFVMMRCVLALGAVYYIRTVWG